MSVIAEKLSGKVVLITGGTGSFGKTVVKGLLETDVKEIRIFSRDELKQELMRIDFANDKLKFYIGDVRDKDSVDKVMQGVDLVFHAAALKQVPSCEFFPMQAVLTNIIGSNNVIQAAIKHNVEKVVCLSTDKAVYPVNAMGMSKALLEKVAAAASRQNMSGDTVVCSVRYGNVMCSRGSVIPLFVRQIKEGKPVLVRMPKIDFVNDKAGKPVGIYEHIGRRPILAFGNSDSDMQMIEYTMAGEGRRLGLFVHHTDADREYAYDRKSHVGTLDKAPDQANANGWIVVDMKKDWKTVFSFENSNK